LLILALISWHMTNICWIL